MAQLPQRRDVRRMTVMLVLFLTLAPGLGRAANILLVDRSIRVAAIFGDPFLGDLRLFSVVDTVGYGEWAASLTEGDGNPVSASQVSIVDSLKLSGIGSVVAGNTGTNAESHYRVVFSVYDDTPYDFAVDNVDSDPVGLNYPGGQVKLDRVDPGNFSLILESIYSVRLGRVAGPGSGLPDFADDGSLAPGTYSLDYLLRYPGSHHYGPAGSAGFSLLMIPEPGTLVLLAMGLAILGLRHRSGSFG